MNQDPTSCNRSGLITYPPYTYMATVAGYLFQCDPLSAWLRKTSRYFVAIGDSKHLN